MNKDYILFDTIHKLQNNQTHQGLCYVQKETLGEIVGVSRIAIHNLLNRLRKKDLIHFDPEKYFLKTEELWFTTIETFHTGKNTT